MGFRIGLVEDIVEEGGDEDLAAGKDGSHPKAAVAT